MKTIHCWPTPWLEAAMRVGFAGYEGDGKWVFINDKMRDMLAEFGTLVRQQALEEAAEIANDMDYSDGEIARAIRAAGSKP